MTFSRTNLLNILLFYMLCFASCTRSEEKMESTDVSSSVAQSITLIYKQTLFCWDKLSLHLDISIPGMPFKTTPTCSIGFECSFAMPVWNNLAVTQRKHNRSWNVCLGCIFPFKYHSRWPHGITCLWLGQRLENVHGAHRQNWPVSLLIHIQQIMSCLQSSGHP